MCKQKPAFPGCRKAHMAVRVWLPDSLPVASCCTGRKTLSPYSFEQGPTCLHLLSAQSLTTFPPSPPKSYIAFLKNSIVIFQAPTFFLSLPTTPPYQISAYLTASLLWHRCSNVTLLRKLSLSTTVPCRTGCPRPLRTHGDYFQGPQLDT